MAGKKASSFITEEHAHNLPTVRIKRVELHHFKSVQQGKITFHCGREFIPQGTRSDILGLYGQNGSGKTSFIEALSVLRSLMSGGMVPGIYADCVAEGENCAELEFAFDLQYEDGRVREAVYSFCMSGEHLTREEFENKYKNVQDDPLEAFEEDSRVVIFNEKFSLQWEGAAKRQVVVDTSPEEEVFAPAVRRKELTGGSKKAMVTLAVNKQLAREQSRSFLFMKDTLQIFSDNTISKDPADALDPKMQDCGTLNSCSAAEYCRVLLELRLYARRYLYVVDTKSSGFIQLNFGLPIYTMNGRMVFSAKKPEIIRDDDMENIRKEFDNIGGVLGQLVPGLSIGFKEIARTLDKNGDPAGVNLLMAYRNGKELPLRDESDGVRKIISVLSLLIAAYNEKSVTVAIDEFDAGIFEYLLGEILQTMEESGKGQFIFTSHNLRPLEVIGRESLYFTTTNPDNRYIRLKNIEGTNNLRDTYFREIVLCEQEEEVYNRTKRFKIVAALKKAGRNH